MHLKNFTVFGDETLKFGKHLNVIVGENGSGKTHLLKLAYSTIATSWEGGRRASTDEPTKVIMQKALADKLVGVFRPESLGRLSSRVQGTKRSHVTLFFEKKRHRTAFSFATQSKSEVSIEELPTAWVAEAPVYLPTRELLTIYPGFLALYEGRYLEFEETWRDTCVLLGTPLKRGPKEKTIRELLAPLESLMGGSIELEKSGRFYLKTSSGRMEMPLVAEGLRKLGMIARLIATGALLDKGALFWDEPEANLNPHIIKHVARSIMDLCKHGIQVFIATHSLFLMRELHILQQTAYNDIRSRYFGLHIEGGRARVAQGPTLDDIGSITSLEEDLTQADTYLDLETGAAMTDPQDED